MNIEVRFLLVWYSWTLASFSLHQLQRSLAHQIKPPIHVHTLALHCYYTAYSKSRVNTTLQDDAFVNQGIAAQNNQEGIYSLLQPSEDNDMVYVHLQLVQLESKSKSILYSW